MIAEVERLPAGLLEGIIEDRSIARAIAIYQQDPTARSELINLVRVVEFEDVQHEIEAHAKGTDAE